MESVDALSTCSNADTGRDLGEFVDVTAREVPEPWASPMISAEFVDKRYGTPSMSALGRKAKVHPSTISEMMYGTRRTTSESVEKVARALYPGDGRMAEKRRQQVHEWVGRALAEPKPFAPHPDANLLDGKEREVVNELIRLLTASKKGQVQEPRAADEGDDDEPFGTDPDPSV